MIAGPGEPRRPGGHPAPFPEELPYRLIRYLSRAGDVILIIGWMIAAALAKAVTGLLRAVHFNDLARKSGFTEFVH